MQHNYKADIIRLERLLDEKLNAQKQSLQTQLTPYIIAVNTANGACQFIRHERSADHA